MLPLVVMVVLATLYSTNQSKKIDASYSELIDRDVKTLASLSVARAHANRIALFLYEEITEPSPDGRLSIDLELDKIYARLSNANGGSTKAESRSRPGNQGVFSSVREECG